MPSLIVFDLDGTLIDSQRDLVDSVNEVLESFGSDPLPVEQVTAMVGEGARMLVRRALETARVDQPVSQALDRFRLVYNRRLVDHTRPYAGIPDLVDQLATRALLAVLSNKPGAPTTRILDAFSMADRFRWIMGGDSSFPKKPDPTALRYLMNQARADAADTIFVGDSMIDVDTARQAGVQVCAALYGFGSARGDLELGDEDLRATDVPELAGLLDTWLSGVRPARRGPARQHS
jgi:phosphoglycolate phosphatase